MTKDTQNRIGTAFERNAAVLSRRPDVGVRTAVTSVRVVDGLTCEIEEGPWRMTVDMAEKHGGADSGPSPGILGRGALGSCMAISYMMWASRRGIPIDELEVEIRADYDAGTEFGTRQGRPAYPLVRCIVRIQTPALETDVRNLLDEADAHSGYVDLFRNGTDVQRELILQTNRVRSS